MKQIRKNIVKCERIIAKLDNDFNPDNSDWIPRCYAWIIDALSQLGWDNTIKEKKKVNVKNRIVYSECDLDGVDIKVYDKNSCEIKEMQSSIKAQCCTPPSTGQFHDNEKESSQLPDYDKNDMVHTTGINYKGINETLGEHFYVQDMNSRKTAKYITIDKNNNTNSKNYVRVDCNKLELNFDTDFVYIEADYIQTYTSDRYGCELPYVPNIGIVIEAISNYCMYKMLSRGYKHPVFNLSASQYGTNPYYLWSKDKNEAKRAIINMHVNDNNDGSELFRSNFYISTFDPRN